MRSLLLVALLSFSALAQEPLGKDLGGTSQIRGDTAVDSEIVSGLKQALTLSLSNATKLTGVENGFWGNEIIRIPLPDKMQSLEKGLRLAGNGLHLQEFQLAMNRTAESSVRNAEPLFAKAINELNLPDARQVLNGNSTAATDALKRAAAGELAKSLRPTIEAAMTRNNVAQSYNYLLTGMNGLTFGQVAPFDLTSYIANKTIEGIFIMLGREEGKIRNDTQAQVSPLLQKVFAKH